MPAYSEFIVDGRAKYDGPALGIIEPIPGTPVMDVVTVGATLVDWSRHDATVPVRVMDSSTEDIHLYQGMTLGQICEVTDVAVLAGEENTAMDHKVRTLSICQIHQEGGLDQVSSKEHSGEAAKLPDHVQDLFARSTKCLDLAESMQLERLLSEHSDLFAKSPTELGKTSLVCHKIDTGDARPIKQAPRRPPMAFAHEEQKIITQQLEAGVIRESTSSWASPLVYVKKKDGSTRPCVDYRRLNDVTKKDAYPLPRIDDCLDCLSGARCFSTLDLQSGYWQLDVQEEDRPKTAFITRGGLYEYVTMPFGLCGAPATFERYMELVLQGLQWRTLLVYFDDVIVYGRNHQEHMDRLGEVFNRLAKAGLKLKPSKCDLLQEEVGFLGHIVTQHGVKPDPKKIEAIHEWPTPRVVRDIRAFLELTSYYCRFIRGFSTIAAPMNRLTENGVYFDWTEACQTAFDVLKAAIASEDIMAYPDNDGGLFILDTDASDTGIGGVLSQMQWHEDRQEQVERPIVFASKSLTRTQRRYCVTRRELLAVVTFAQQFRHYLLGRRFLIRTDHSALRWIMTFRNPTDQMARWIEVLSQFDFEMSHRAGRKHLNADGLSRMPCDPE